MERPGMLLRALREASANEWIEASAVVSKLEALTGERYPAQTVGRWCAQLAAEGQCERTVGAISKYRVELHAVVAYDGDGVEAGRLLLWQTRDGVELDWSQLSGVLRIDIVGRDIRTVRAAMDAALYRRCG